MYLLRMRSINLGRHGYKPIHIASARAHQQIHLWVHPPLIRRRMRHLKEISPGQLDVVCHEWIQKVRSSAPWSATFVTMQRPGEP